MKKKIDVKKIKELYIATDTFSVFDDSKLRDLNYKKWVEFVEKNSTYFTWYSETEAGKKLAESIKTMPLEKRKTYLDLLEKYRCEAEYDLKKKHYLINVTFYEELKYISISFERKVTINDLEMYYEMAKHLDAQLLFKGKNVIDKNVLENLVMYQICGFYNK